MAFAATAAALAIAAGAAVPEPATWAMMITGFGAAAAMMRRRRAVLAHARSSRTRSCLFVWFRG